MCVCVSVCVCVCVSFASDSSGTVKVIIVKLGAVTASDTKMHSALAILTLTFIPGHTYLHHGNNKCLIVSETIQAMPIRFAENIVRLNIYITIAIPMNLTFIQGHKCVSNLTTL